MTKQQLIDRLASIQSELRSEDVREVVELILAQITLALEQRQRVEIRGFGSLEVRERAPAVGRNPKTGQQVNLPKRYIPHFKAGKELRERVNIGRDTDS